MARGRPPKVFVRVLSNEEEAELQRLIRKGERCVSPITCRRALVVLMSRQGRRASDIAGAVSAKPDWVRNVIQAFNTGGVDALPPKWSGGRPRVITGAMRTRIAEVATTRPQLLKEPYARWSLPKLRDYLIRTRVVPAISTERLREILAEEKISIQRTKSWKRSPDPDFDAKAARVQELYETLPGPVVCFDEHGPVQPVPKPGWGWAHRGLPHRLPANYRKPHGVRFFFGCYDVGQDQLFGRWFDRKGAATTIKALKVARRRHPARVRLYVVMDNLSAHWTEDVRSWAEASNVELVPTPTYASWLNRIEAQFGVLHSFVMAGSDYRTHAEIQAATSAFLRRRNAEARRDFALRELQRKKRRDRRTRARRARLAWAA